MMGPLAILLPRKVRGADSEHRPLVERKGVQVGARDWNITFCAAAYLLGIVNPALTPFKIIYSKYKFGWGVEETAYWTSLNSLAKLLTLVFAIPLVTRKLRPTPPEPAWPRPGMDGVVNPAPPQADRTRSTNADADATESAFSIFSRVADEQEAWDAEHKRLKVETEAAFDHKLALGSMALALVGYGLMSYPRANELSFLASTCVVQFSGGVGPALQSLALALSSPRDSGRLLAGLSVLASASMQVLGPALFGAVLGGTLGDRPEVVWAAAAGWWAVAFVPMGLIKVGGGEREAGADGEAEAASQAS